MALKRTVKYLSREFINGETSPKDKFILQYSLSEFPDIHPKMSMIISREDLEYFVAFLNEEKRKNEDLPF